MPKKFNEPDLSPIDLSQLNIDTKASDQEKLRIIDEFLDQKTIENLKNDPFDPIDNPVARDLRRSFRHAY